MGLLLRRVILMSRFLRNYFKRLWEVNNGDEQLKEAEADGTKEIKLYFDWFDAPPYDFIETMIEQLGNEAYKFFIWRYLSVDFKTGKSLIIIS